MKRIYLSSVLSLCSLVASSQGYFIDLPRNFQLYPRNANDQADVVFSGVTDPGLPPKYRCKLCARAS